ncbi:hypothetical protein HDU86_006303 [Geranomyces michiganensis]|nr:hypothetical protein HDU86_006303 [Geranomyces michiganensis]
MRDARVRLDFINRNQTNARRFREVQEEMNENAQRSERAERFLVHRGARSAIYGMSTAICSMKTAVHGMTTIQSGALEYNSKLLPPKRQAAASSVGADEHVCDAVAPGPKRKRQVAASTPAITPMGINDFDPETVAASASTMRYAITPAGMEDTHHDNLGVTSATAKSVITRVGSNMHNDNGFASALTPTGMSDSESAAASGFASAITPTGMSESESAAASGFASAITPTGMKDAHDHDDAASSAPRSAMTPMEYTKLPESVRGMMRHLCSN